MATVRMVNHRTLTLLITPMRRARSTTHVHVAILFVKSATIRPTWMVLTKRPNACMHVIATTPHTTNDVLDVTPFHRTGMVLFRCKAMATLPLFGIQLQKRLRFHLTLYIHIKWLDIDRFDSFMDSISVE